MTNMITLIINTNNNDRLSLFLNSLRTQTYKNYEAIFYSRNSDCNAMNEIFNESIKDQRIKMIENFNGELNELVANAAGEYIVFIDLTKILKKKALESMLEALRMTDRDVLIMNDKCEDDYYVLSDNEVKDFLNVRAMFGKNIYSNTMIGKKAILSNVFGPGIMYNESNAFEDKSVESSNIYSLNKANNSFFNGALNWYKN